MSTDRPDDVLRVVAVCHGHRCAALLAGQEPDGLGSLRRAAGASARGVLVSTACPGLCAHGPVVTVGDGVVDGGTLHLTSWTAVGPLDAPAVAAVTHLLAGTGPVVVPPSLRGLALSERCSTSGAPERDGGGTAGPFSGAQHRPRA